MHLYPQGRGRTGGVTQSSEWAHLLSHAHAATSAVIQTQQQMSPLQKGPAATSLQSQQQLYVYPQYRVVRSPATQSQQRMHPTPKLQHAYLSSQEQLGSRAVLSQQGRRYSLPHRTVLTSAAQSQQPASHIQSQQIASRQPALHSQQQVDLHSRVRRQSIPDLLQTRRQLIDQLMVQSSGSSPRVIQYRQQQDCQPQPRHNAFSVQQMAAPARTSQALGAQQHRSPSLGAASNAGACIGPQGNVDLSSNRRGVYPLDNSNYNLKLRRYLQAYSDAGSPRACSDSLSESMICSPASTGRNQPSNPEVRDFTFISQSPRLSHPSHAEPRVRSPTLDAAAEDDIKVGECGGYAVDHEAFPRIIAVHSAGAHKKIHASASFSDRPDATQDDGEVIITGVRLRGAAPPAKRPPSAPLHEQPKRICLGRKSMSPQVEHLLTVGEREQITRRQSLPSREPATADVLRELNSPGLSTQTGEYLSAHEFLKSHTQATPSEPKEAGFSSPAACDTELDFGGPPPYLPLREPSDVNAPESHGSRTAAPRQPVLSGATENGSNSSASQGRVGLDPTELWKKGASLGGSAEVHEKGSTSENEYSASSKVTKPSNTVESLCFKIAHTRERIKREEIMWKKKVLYRLLTMFMKKLVKIEQATGKQAAIDIPREGLAKKMGKRRSSRSGSSDSESGRLNSGKGKKSPSGSEGKGNGAIEELLTNRPKAQTDTPKAEADPTGSTDSQTVMEHSEVEQKKGSESTSETQPQVYINEDAQDNCTEQGAHQAENRSESLTECSSVDKPEKITEVKRAVIKPYSQLITQAKTKREDAEENGKEDDDCKKPSSGEVSSVKASEVVNVKNEDSYCGKFKPGIECVRDESQTVPGTASTIDCNRNIWSVLETFSM